MPRKKENLIRVDQFGGLNLAAPQKGVAISDCVDNLNVHTANGAIEVRPGYGMVHRSALIQQARNPIVKAVSLNSSTYVVWVALDYSSLTKVVLRTWNPDSLYGWYTTAESSDGEQGGRPTIRTFGNRVYAVWGSPGFSRKMYVVDGIWKFQRIGIAAPTEAPTATPTGTGPFPLTLPLSYRCTYYNKDAGVESGPSPTIKITDPISGDRLVIQHDRSSDDQARYTRFYRREHSVDSTWYLIGEASGAPAQWIDDGGEIRKTFDDEIPLTSDLPPTSRSIEEYKQRMWWAIASTARVRYSDVLAPERVSPLNSFDIGTSSDPIVGQKAAFGRLLFFKERSVWAITGSTPSSWVVEHIGEGCGCVADGTIVDIYGAIYWVGRSGVYRLTSGGIQNLSIGRIPDLLDVFTSELRILSAYHDPIRHLYVICGPYGTTGNRQLVYDYVRNAWHIWNLPVSSGDLCEWEDSSGRWNRRIILAGDNYPAEDTVVELAGTVDNYTGTDRAIEWRWTMPETDFGVTRHKKYFYLSIGQGEQGADVFATVDGNTIGAVNRTKPTAKIGTVDRETSIMLSGSTLVGEAVTSVEIDAEVVNYR